LLLEGRLEVVCHFEKPGIHLLLCLAHQTGGLLFFFWGLLGAAALLGCGWWWQDLVRGRGRGLLVVDDRRRRGASAGFAGAAQDRERTVVCLVVSAVRSARPSRRFESDLACWLEFRRHIHRPPLRVRLFLHLDLGGKSEAWALLPAVGAFL
jgi:hypothetical protein